MTTPSLRLPTTTDITTVDNPYRRQAADVQSAFAQRAEQIRADKTITDAERHIRMGDAHSQATAKMTELAAAEDAHLEQRKTAIHSQLYGLRPTGSDPSSVIVARDAVDRASRIEDADAAAAQMARATMNGDTTMVKAIAAAASENGWSGVTAAYLGEHPHLQRAADELDGINAMSSVQAKFGRAMAYAVPMPSGYSEQQSRAWAASQATS